MVQGTADNIHWEIASSNRESWLLATEGERTYRVQLRRNEVRRLAKSKYVDEFMKMLIPFLFMPLPPPLGPFLHLDTLTQNQWNTVTNEDDPWRQLALIATYGYTFPDASVCERQRIVSILSQMHTGRVKFNSSVLLTRPTLRNLSLMEWLDVQDFFLNGLPHENFREFNKIHGGRTFGVPHRIVNGVGFALRQDRLAMNLYLYGRMIHRFCQLSKRSVKLRDQVEILPLQKLLGFLSFDLPGTLLATDTLKLMRRLKNISPLDRLAAAPLPGDANFNLIVGRKMGREITELGFEKQMRAILNPAQARNVIVDLASANHLEGFIAYAMITMGVAEALCLCMTLARETSGVTMRGFMELVERNGFSENSLPAWEAPLLGLS